MPPKAPARRRNSSLEVDEVLGKTFSPITEPIPEIPPLTEEEQDRMGQAMLLPFEKWKSLVRRPVLTLPTGYLTQQWANWAAANNNLPKGAGFILMEPSQYDSFVRGPSSERRGFLEPHFHEQQYSHIRSTGKPIVVWSFVTASAQEWTISLKHLWLK